MGGTVTDLSCMFCHKKLGACMHGGGVDGREQRRGRDLWPAGPTAHLLPPLSLSLLIPFDNSGVA